MVKAEERGGLRRERKPDAICKIKDTALALALRLN